MSSEEQEEFLKIENTKAEKEDFLNIENTTQLENFLKKYYFNEENEKVKEDCIVLYTSSLPELKTLYQHEFGEVAGFNLSNRLKLQGKLKETEKYKDCDENNFRERCRDKISENINTMVLFEWLQKNGGYEDDKLSHEKLVQWLQKNGGGRPHEVLVEEFFNRLNKSTYYKPVSVENSVCDMNLSPYREKVKTTIRGIYANVLSVPKILNEGRSELLNDIVYCISAQFGMRNLQLNEDGTIKLREIDKLHQIKKTINIHDEEKLVLFEWNKSIIFCEGFQIKEIITGNKDINFAGIPKGLYNYILVCFVTGSDKKYRLESIKYNDSRSRIIAFEIANDPSKAVDYGNPINVKLDKKWVKANGWKKGYLKFKELNNLLFQKEGFEYD